MGDIPGQSHSLKGIRIIITLATLMGLAMACSPPSAGQAVRLGDLEPLPDRGPTQRAPLRVAVANVISPKGTLESYQPLLDYLEEQTGRPVELVQRRTYAETNDLIRRGDVELAFVCTSAYVAGHDSFGMELLVAPVVQGEIVYYSELIVAADSPAKSIADLRGGVFAFTDPMSFTGRVYPAYLVQQLGETPELFFARTFYTYSHDDAIRAVAQGLADGAAVDSLVLQLALDRNPGLRERIKIIDRSPPFGIPPVVVGPGVRPQQRALLAEMLEHTHEDPEGAAALAALGIERFVPIEDQAYQAVRELARSTGLGWESGP